MIAPAAHKIASSLSHFLDPLGRERERERERESEERERERERGVQERGLVGRARVGTNAGSSRAIGAGQTTEHATCERPGRRLRVWPWRTEAIIAR